jgi:hypothetical protein
LAVLFLTYDEAEHHGGRAWPRKAAHLLVARKERGKKRGWSKIYH